MNVSVTDMDIGCYDLITLRMGKLMHLVKTLKGLVFQFSSDSYRNRIDIVTLFVRERLVSALLV